MKVETTTKESHPALVLRGDFETDAAASFLAAVDQLLASGNPNIMVSFRYVKYINSTALGAVVRARSNCKEKGGDLVIVQPSRLSREIITKMGLESVLRIFDDEAEAARHLQGSGSAAPVASAATSAGAAPEVSDEIRVMFSFDDDRSKLIPGKSRHGVGVLESVDSSSLVFRWDPDKHDADPSIAATLFPTGSKMRNKLQIKLIRKEFFEAESTIERLTLNETGGVTIAANWSRMTDADRSALDSYREDMKFLSEQRNESAGDS